MIRSFLFVPADSERKLAGAPGCGADALILDLEDSVADAQKPRARQRVAEFLAGDAPCPVWVRINPLDSPHAAEDLRAIAGHAPAGVILPKPSGAADVRRLSELLDAHERSHGFEPGCIGILPIATERPAALFRMHEYADSTERLEALTWGAEDLSAAVGAAAVRDADGEWLPPYALARSLCLFAAAAAGVAAIETVFTEFRDRAGLEACAARARRDGFAGMLAIHPAQVEVINRAFQPTREEVERARRIVALFDTDPGAGTVGLDGEMIDRPHLLRARRILEIASRGA